MRTCLQRSQKTLLGGGRKNLCPGGKFDEQLLEDFKVELGINVIEQEDRRLVKTALPQFPTRLSRAETSMGIEAVHSHLL